MSLFSSLYVGTSGLQTGMNALNTVSHNLVNASTEGYTRQQVEQSDKSYITLSKTASKVAYQQAGLGVSYSNVKQVRDVFLDKTYRTESGRNEFYNLSSDVLLEVEDMLGELDGEAFQETLGDLWTSIEELSKDPCNSVTESTLVHEAAKFIDRAKGVYDGLANFQDNLNAQVKMLTDRINDTGAAIQNLNDQIRAIEAGGVERANDLRDTRNNYLDQLAELTSISYKEDMWGNVSVQIEGEDFIKGSTLYKIGLKQDETTGFYTPFWPQNAEYILNAEGNKEYYDISNANVFNLDKEISTEKKTDIGGLKAIMYARGDHRANYTDIQNNYSKVSQSVLMNVEAEFDQLVHNIMTSVNDVLANASGRITTGPESGYRLTDITFEDGTTDTGLDQYGNNNTYQFVVDNPGGYLRSEYGYPLEVFSKTTTDAYTKASATVTGPDGSTSVQTVWIKNKEDAADPNSLYSVANTNINQELMQAPAKLGFRLKDGSEDIATMNKLKEIFTTEDYSLNPTVVTKVNLMDYYNNLVAQVANSSYVYKSIYENQSNTVEAASGAREQISAVSTDEELSNMVKFQSAYNASSRYINVVDEMLEHILNTLGT